MGFESEETVTFLTLLKAFKADPTDHATGEDLARAADKGDRWNELMEICDAWLIEAALPRSARLSLMLTMGKWYADLDRPGLAIVYFEKVLQVVPEHLGALESIAAVLEEVQEFNALEKIRERIDRVRRDLEDDDEAEDEADVDERLG